MSEDLSDMINNVKSMMDSGNIPDNIKEMLGNLSNNSSTSSSAKTSSNSPNSSTSSNIDIATVLKIKSMIECINSKDDPRANLLYALKPYLRESRKSKLDQYINLLNMTKIADIMKNENKENSTNDYK